VPAPRDRAKELTIKITIEVSLQGGERRKFIGIILSKKPRGNPLSGDNRPQALENIVKGTFFTAERKRGSVLRTASSACGRRAMLPFALTSARAVMSSQVHPWGGGRGSRQDLGSHKRSGIETCTDRDHNSGASPTGRRMVHSGPSEEREEGGGVLHPSKEKKRRRLCVVLVLLTTNSCLCGGEGKRP